MAIVEPAQGTPPGTPPPPRGKYARRAVDGILLLDKPAGYTSNQVLSQAKRLLAAKKAGHTGSLDPLATGLLPLCFGEATKVSQYLLDSDKRYHAVFRLGESTTTYDAEGEVTARRPVNVSRADVEAAVRRFTGEIGQIPPMYSAIKREGKPLYELARAGVEIERAPRRVTVFEFKVIALDGSDLEVEIHCSKGTYVRALAHDLGEMLGCGAHVVRLARTGMGAFQLSEAISLAALAALPDPVARAALLVPGDRALAHLPVVQISDTAVYYFLQGQPVTAPRGKAAAAVRVYQAGERFLGIGELTVDGQLLPKRLVRAG
jgi:tRNA pseudouridine55 synthase